MYTILSLPVEIWGEILKNTEYPTILKFLNSCKSFQRLIYHSFIINLKEYKKEEYLDIFETMLNEAISNGDMQKLKNLVLYSEIKLSEFDKVELPPLINACLTDEWDMAIFLAQNGADINIFADNGNRDTPLQMAFAQLRDPRLIAKLLEIKADPNITDCYGVSVLNYAVSISDVEIVKILLEVNANPLIVDMNGHSAYTRALSSNFEGCLKLIEDSLNNKRSAHSNSE